MEPLQVSLGCLLPVKSLIRSEYFSNSRYNRILKKSAILKKSKTYILHNNNTEKLINKTVKKIIVPFFISNEFIDFLESTWIFQFFWEFWQMNVTLRILDVFLDQDSTSHTRLFQVIELTVARLQPHFFSKTVFWKTKKMEAFIWILKNQYIYLKWKRNRLADYLLKNYFVYQFVNKFSALLLLKGIFWEEKVPLA